MEQNHALHASHRVKVRIQPGQSLAFPSECIHCSGPASERMRLRKRHGRMTRLIDVPLCADCAREVHRLSGDEERWQKLSWLLAGIVWLIALALFLLLLPASWGFLFRFVGALIIALFFAVGTYLYGKQVALRHARPEKQAILAAAEIDDFSWRATTFTFSNDAFAERFADLNAARLMDA